VSATTRIGKPQDVFGKRYQFVTEPDFRHMLEREEFLEYAYVFGNWYGTLKTPVQEALAEGRTILLEIDDQGAIQVHKLFPDAVGVFILPPGMDDLETRLRDRARDDEATMQRRLAEAQQEIRTGQVCGAYDLMVVNEDDGVEMTVETIRKAVQKYRGATSNEPKLF